MRETKPHVLFPLALNRRSLRKTQRLALRRMHIPLVMHREACVNVGEFSAPTRRCIDNVADIIQDFHPMHAVIFGDDGVLQSWAQSDAGFIGP